MRTVPIHAAATARGRPGRGCPLPLWRTRLPTDISEAELAAVTRAVSSAAILHERRWPAARSGDAAAAVAVAVGRLRGPGPEGAVSDLVMSNLLLVARRDGDPAARMVLSHALRALARRRGRGAGLVRLADAWSRRPAGGPRRNHQRRGR
ncbi:hypothetical protein QO012_001551 [Methylobacterium aerolatum]|uniref:Uncharacterized protein n=1 Tax=Methylobacterium aerolatum TaxID=418708 RepID=A0ABU0HXK4_9HYPH|nr:hypothetical protein [Methylobacterium aerolatum]GJD37221.1 hypothetical protein FMGBMHLM_4148 [Methylobacterium aerolatum]